MNGSTETIAEAFSLTAEKYDAFAQDHPHLTRMRGKVYAHLERFLQPGARILELNAGSGVDAVHLASQGYSVQATDVAPGMLARLQAKVEQSGLGERIHVQNCSYLDLDQVQAGPFDSIFSDMGGLNCIPELTPVIRALPRLLKPGGLGADATRLPVGVGRSLSRSLALGLQTLFTQWNTFASRRLSFQCLLFFSEPGGSLVWARLPGAQP